MSYTDITLEYFVFLIAWIILSFGVIVPIIIYLSDLWVVVKEELDELLEKLGKSFIGVPAWVWRSTIISFVIVVLLIIVALVAGIGLENINYIILVLAAVVASPFAIWRMTITHRQADIQQQSVHTDSYFKAVDNLEHKNILIKTGAIHELGKIVGTSKDHHQQIVELLCSYIRENATEDESKKQGNNNLAIDIQAALDGLGQRSAEWIEEIESLRKFCMNLDGIHIKNANLVELNFKHAFLTEAHLERAILYGAHLERANLEDAHLERANLEDAHLEGADLKGADLKGANLIEADLKGAKYLEQTQIDSAFGDATTTLPPNLTRPKHWPNRTLNGFTEWRKWLKDPENYQPPKE